MPPADGEFVLVVAPTWAGRIGQDRVAAEGPAALHGVPLVAYAKDPLIARRYWRHAFGVRPTGRAAITVPDLRGVLAAVVAGAGFSALPRCLCLDELASGTLIPLLAPEDSPVNTAYLAQRPGPGVSDNPYVALVQERLPAAGRTW